jgi:PmbA protein
VTPLEAAKEAVTAARGAGAGSADALAVAFRETRLVVRRGELETSQESETRGVGVRAFREGRTGVAYTTDVTPAGLRRAGREAADLAAAAGPDEAAGLPAPEHRGAATAIPGLDDPAFESVGPERALEAARAAEAAAFAEDARVTNSQGAAFRSSRSTVALAASDGFEGSYRRTRFGLEVTVIAEEEGGVLQRDGWWTADTALARLDDPASVGREAARRTARRLGWRKVETRSVPVILAPDVAASLAAEVARACCGDALVRGASFLADSLGKAVASPLLTLVDDPRLPGRLGSRPFDGEGARTARKPILEKGILRSFLFDSRSLRKLAAERPDRARGGTPGNAARGLGGSTSSGTTNLVVEPGTSTPAGLIAGVADGFFVTETMGFGVNPVSGEYSKGAAGIWIRDGRLDHPVQEVTIAGDLRSMLEGVDGVADDLDFRAECAAPTIRIARMTVSGA